jgi:hypothetical protein
LEQQHSGCAGDVEQSEGGDCRCLTAQREAAVGEIVIQLQTEKRTLENKSKGASVLQARLPKTEKGVQ